MLTLEQRIFLVEHVFREGDKYTDAVKWKFIENFPDTAVPHRDTVRDLIIKFRLTGSVLEAPRSGLPPVLSEDKVLEISEKFFQNPSKSIRRIAEESAVSLGSAHTVAKKVREAISSSVHATNVILNPADFVTTQHSM